MVKRKVSVPECFTCAPKLSPKEQKERYTKDYGFVKAPSVRSPLSGWEQGYFQRGGGYMMPDKEVILVEGKSVTFKHRRDGNSYGNRPTRRKSK